MEPTSAAGGGGGISGGISGGVLGAPPSSAQQFESEWRTLQQTPAGVEARAAWLRRLPASEYAGLWKESLSEATMVSVLSCVRDAAKQVADAAAEPDAAEAACALARQVLEGLASTRRFSLLLMFLEAKQKAAVKAVFSELARLGRPAPAKLAQAWEQ